MITIYTIAWNEEFMLPYFIKHYRSRFTNCAIVVYDNESTDATADIAREHGCEVRTFKTNNTLSDRSYLEIKNNCWKDAKTDWVLIADVDEHLNIYDSDLRHEQAIGSTYIRAHGFNMVNLKDHLLPPVDITHGVRAPSYDKIYCFNKTKIKEINYRYGCHKADIIGELIQSRTTYTCRHYKYLDLQYMIKRHGLFAKRMSVHNLQHGYGGHYLYTPKEITEEFTGARKKAVEI